MDTNVIVLADLTALFSTRERFRKNINYKAVDEFIKTKMNIKNINDDSVFFTLYHPGNEKQNNFIKFLKSELNWNVEGIKTFDIRKGIEYQQYRFDTQIAYELGLLFRPEEPTRILVISDSFELAKPMIEVAGEHNTEVTLGFFSDALDGRWYKILQNPENKINFLDFELMQGNRQEELNYST